MADEIHGIEQWTPDQNEDSDQTEQEQEEQEQRREDDRRQNRRRRKKKKKLEDPRKKLEEKRKKIEEAKQRLKKAREHAKKTARDIKKSGKKLADIGKKSGKAINRATAPARALARRVAVNTMRVVAQVVSRLVQQAVKIAAKIAQLLVQVLVKVIAFLISNPIGWIILVVIAVIIIVVLFMGDKNEEIAGLGGGSKSIGISYESEDHRDLVDGLLAKTEGSNPSLVIRGPGLDDLKWKEIVINEETGETIMDHELDLRVLKAIEYLTNLHEYVEIGMLYTDSPDLVRDNVVIDSEATGGEDETIVLETLSAFSTGQAFAIIAVDRTEIPELIPPSGEAPPIAVSWQKTLLEKAIRPLWEEVAFDVGVLDRNIPAFKDLFDSEQGVGYGNASSVEQKLAYARISGSSGLYKNSFRILKRIIVLIDRVLGIEDYLDIDLTNASALDSRTLNYFVSAKDQINPIIKHLEENILNGVDLDELEISPEDGGAVIDRLDMIEAIKYLGHKDSLERIHNGARFIYKATQVANMVNWDKSTNLDFKKAYESRNKIRQVIKELLEMPREVSISSETSFDETMVAKQIITFSPEDDLDNGPERVDVYPYGIKYVDVGGVAMEVLTDDGIADGIINYPDIHFSHAPVSANGVFSKSGVNYINEDVSSDILADALGFMDETKIKGQTNEMHNILTGDCEAFAEEECQKSSYKDYIFVGF